MAVQAGKWVALVLVAVGVLATTASAVVIPDATGEEFSGNAHLDISSVEVTNTPTDITFKINLVGNPVATDWGKYMIGIDAAEGGATSGNGWNRPISMSGGMDYWIGSWADFGTGQEVYHFDGANWVRDRMASELPLPVVTTDSVALTMPLSLLGFTGNQNQTRDIRFDVYTSGGGGGDSANDASSNPNQSVSNWPGPYDSGNLVSTYTVVIPEPASLGLLGAAALGLLARRRR